MRFASTQTFFHLTQHESTSTILKEDLYAYCHGPDAIFVADSYKYGGQVVRIGRGAVIKFGYTVKRSEFDNLKFAKALVDPSIVYVPEAYRFFTDNDSRYGNPEDVRGYIIMEYVQGKRIGPLEDPEKVQRVAKIVSHFATIEGTLPGTLNRGPSGGNLLPQNGRSYTFDSMKQLEAWLHKRLLPHDDKPSIKDSPLVLCHLDVAPRNIIWKDDGSICFVDWATAGFYPRYYEVAAQLYAEGRDGKFNRLLVVYMEPLSVLEESQCRAVMIARDNAERYNL